MWSEECRRKGSKAIRSSQPLECHGAIQERTQPLTAKDEPKVSARRQMSLRWVSDVGWVPGGCWMSDRPHGFQRLIEVVSLRAKRDSAWRGILETPWIGGNCRLVIDPWGRSVKIDHYSQV